MIRYPNQVHNKAFPLSLLCDSECFMAWTFHGESWLDKSECSGIFTPESFWCPFFVHVHLKPRSWSLLLIKFLDWDACATDGSSNKSPSLLYQLEYNTEKLHSSAQVVFPQRLLLSICQWQVQFHGSEREPIKRYERAALWRQIRDNKLLSEEKQEEEGRSWADLDVIFSGLVRFAIWHWLHVIQGIALTNIAASPSHSLFSSWIWIMNYELWIINAKIYLPYYMDIH